MDHLDFDMNVGSVGKPIKIYRNGDVSEGKDISLSVNWTKNAFLAAAGRRLGLSHPKRIFSLDGTEIDDIISIGDDETVFISEGEDFQRPEGSGACVAGYEVKKMLGKGGFGEVRLGIHMVTQEKVAMKFMSKATFQSASAAERVVTEIQALTALHHPSVIKMMDVVNQVDFVVLIFEFAAGGDLFEYVSDCKLGRLSEYEARHIFRQILSAVAYAHNHNICHGDLKLENILLANRQVTHKADESDLKTTDGNTDKNHESSHNLEVKVADFGLSVFLKRGEKSKAVGGSTSYMAPEVWNNEDIMGEALDVWCLGCILFSMLTGRLPFDDGKVSDFRIPSDTTMINRVNNLVYSFQNSEVSRAAKDCVARQLVVDMNERTTIAVLFNHPWMAHRRDSDLDVSHLLKGNMAGVIHNMEYGEASQMGGQQPPLPGMSSGDVKHENEAGSGVANGEQAKEHMSPCHSFNSDISGETNIFDNMSPMSAGSLPSLNSPNRLSSLDGLSASAQAQQKIAEITQRSGVKSATTSGNQDRGRFLKQISRKSSKGTPSSPLKTPNSAIIAGRKTLRGGSGTSGNGTSSGNADFSPIPTLFTKTLEETPLTPTPPGPAKKKVSASRWTTKVWKEANTKGKQRKEEAGNVADEEQPLRMYVAFC